VFGDVDYSSSAARLAPLDDEWCDSVVPAGVEVVADSPYAAGYAWMYAYERGVRRRVARALGRPLGAVWERRLFGADGVVSEGLSNAFLHGHRRDGSLPIQVCWAVSRKGLAALIADGGPGFDVTRCVGSLRGGRAYFHVAGNGLRTFARSREVVVSFARGGRELHAFALFVHDG
jgi:hypothetical protein